MQKKQGNRITINVVTKMELVKATGLKMNTINALVQGLIKSKVFVKVTKGMYEISHEIITLEEWGDLFSKKKTIKILVEHQVGLNKRIIELKK
ncbi:MAG: hypothetical protein HQK52_19350 [Oligoflexia bacterium]|nr:hypothetical protein [Oligoflexia bacterium]